MTGDDQTSVVLPSSFGGAAVRGMRGHCPRCAESRLFVRFLKPADRCPRCGQDWSPQQADDFPAYIAIFVTGHALAPIIIALVATYAIPPTALAAILLPASAAVMMLLLQPAKGAVIAFQWWHGMHGFTRERVPVARRAAPATDADNRPA